MNHQQHPAAWGQPLTAHQQFDMYSTIPVGRAPPVAHAEPVSHTHHWTEVQGRRDACSGQPWWVLVASPTSQLTPASYGSLARFRDIERLKALGTHTVLGAAGDMSDFQREEETLKLSDNHPALAPRNLYTFLANLFYARRSKINPLWNACIIGGWDFEKDEPFLGYVDLLGTTYTAPTLATGFGMHLAQPLLREAYEAKAGIDGKGDLLTEAEAEAVLNECMKVLYYRDARSMNKYQLAKVTKEGVKISDSKSAETYWGFAEGLRGYGSQTQ
ncbi:endopeptidase [Trichosporon asahii var. asahii CBS 2479]|uniref:Endopeptidase n=1 Tax=Trichosporon asahii var. asahii (strain ATCC 90039 / CBS 2479 / JCM 2466 / KCTC 7840 / NBRC 103889/ NCYC 2677 / UAMH 7654) TaxID=1186058 RepID=J6F642_TRIAS|nr:endopeptidase [Trichosporon asahii var. asahii CBS 2479]EJT50782.1 endopeptidase [Trichosporon asahii var. asahii CBS 2479]